MAPKLEDCDCGIIDAQDPTQSTFTSFFAVDFTAATTQELNNLFITATYRVDQSDAPYVRAFGAGQVQYTGAGLHLTVSPPAGNSKDVPCAQILTRDISFFYGSYRARLQVGDVPGTVTAFYNYYNDSSEVDIEYLSAWQDPTLLYTVKPQIYFENGNPDNRTYQQGVWNGTQTTFGQDFHDWSFVWLPEAIHYGLDENFTKSITTDVPQTPGRIALNHWSNGDPRYSLGPPTQNSTNTISFLQAVYNDSSAPALACKKSTSPCFISDGILQTSSSTNGGGSSSLRSTSSTATVSAGNTVSTLPAVSHINSANDLETDVPGWLLLLCFFFMVR